MTTVGIVGTGFIARGLLYVLEYQRGLKPGPVLTRRPIKTCKEFPRPDLLTNSLERLIGNCDLIVECSGHPLHAAEVIDAALAAGIPVLTSDVEFHVTLGSCFEGRGYLSETEGDQPGSFAALRTELMEMGFTPTAYGNLKRFSDLNPTRSNMEHWSERQGISLQQVTAFTDGTKLQLEMALTANAFGAGILQAGLRCFSGKDTEVFGRDLAAAAQAASRPIVDYAVSPEFPAGVLITARADDVRQAPYLKYLKMGDGPDYTFVRPYHLCHIEMIKTIRRTLAGAPPLLTNGGDPTVSVAAVAKRHLGAGEVISCAMGSFETRGICVNIADEPDHVPIGLLYDAVVTKPVAEGEIITWDQVELPDSFALSLWKSTHAERGGRASHLSVAAAPSI